MHLSPTLRIIIIVLLFGAAGCSRLLPSGKVISTSPWVDYNAAKTAFDKIEVGKTTVDDLGQLGFDVKTYPNLKVLNYLDVATMVQTIPMDQLDIGLQACLRARTDCRAYVFEPSRIYSQRTGNFVLDILNFRRQTEQTGWRFKALIVFVNNYVAYKLSSGEPQIDNLSDQNNPLGPLQDSSGFVMRFL